MKLIDTWKRDLLRLWSMRIAILWMVVGLAFTIGALISDAAQEKIGPWRFGVVMFVCGLSFGIARLLKQPGTEGIDP